MNVSLAQDLSVYQLALGLQATPQALPLSPATLLSLLRSQIDLLIKQKITATLWVKLPPGECWHSEIRRYQQLETPNNTLHYCNQENEKQDGEVNKIITPPLPNYIQFDSLPESKLQREYFLLVLSPQFCSLIVACKPMKSRKNQKSVKAQGQKALSLLAVTTFEGQVIQQVFNSIKESIAPELSSLIEPTDFVCPSAPEPTLMNLLLGQQLHRQDEINHQILTKRLVKVQQQNQKLHETVQRKDEYLSTVCQELRTPLTHMKTALSLLNSPNLKPPQRQRYLQMLNTQCDRQNTLITGVLDLVHLERNLEGMPLEPVRLSEVVPGVVSTYQPLAKEKGIMLAYTVPTQLPCVWCVSGGMRQIVINLLFNSIKFTPTGGQVWVRARVQSEFVQLEFRDTGIGIAETELSKIFNRFYRVRPVATDDSGGVGLGLTIVQLLVQRCGGSISVKSKLSEGSTFTVQLPSTSNTPR